jgi:hypothetical protein
MVFAYPLKFAYTSYYVLISRTNIINTSVNYGFAVLST